MPLGLLFVAVQLLDFLWTILNLAGVEHTEIAPGITAASPLNFVSYPFSHGLLAAVIWSGLVYLVMRYGVKIRGRLPARTAWIMAVAVFSHWVLDWFTHRADLPLAGNESVKTGLGLWNHPAAALLLEAVITIGGLALYLRRSRENGLGGKFGMILLMSIVLLFTVVGMMGGSPPPNVPILAATALVMYVVIALLAGWLDRKRTVLEMPSKAKRA